MSDRRGYTLLEMATTVAALVIVLGLMVSLARHVRDQSSNELTVELLRKLDRLMSQYQQRNDGHLPTVTRVMSGESRDETSIRRLARLNNEQFLRALRGTESLAKDFSDLSIATYDEVNLRDAWGEAIVFMPEQHPDIGMAPRNRFFFFSAGPDRQYLTRTDNLYSYEAVSSGP